MNDYIKAMCLKLAELALEIKDIYVSIVDYGISIHHFESEGEGTIFYDDISFKYNSDAEERIEKALDYVKSLGGNNNES